MGDTHVNELIRGLKANPGVKDLDLSGNKFTDDGVVLIAKAVSDTQVTHLTLAGNKLTDKCTEPLAAVLRTNKVIRMVDLSGHNITNRVARNKIRNSLTQCEVKF